MIKSVLAALTAGICLMGCSQNTETTMDSQSTDALSVIMTRKSVRKFKPEKLSDAQIETLLRAGMAAPSAVNKQPWEFIVVDDAALLDSLQASCQNFRIANGCQQVLVVCGNEQKAIEGEGKTYWIQDCSAATENILLAAHSMGLGAVWCGVTPIKERMAKVAEILNVPSYVKPFAVICVGVPDEAPEVKDKWNPANVHKNAEF